MKTKEKHEKETLSNIPVLFIRRIPLRIQGFIFKEKRVVQWFCGLFERTKHTN